MKQSSYSKITLEQVAQRVYENADDAVRVKQVDPLTIGGEIQGEFQQTPASDFRVGTYTVTGTPTVISFPNFDITSISIRALSTNNGDVRIGKAADIATTYYLLDPQGVFSQNVQASASPVAFMLHTGTTVATVTLVATGNPI